MSTVVETHTRQTTGTGRLRAVGLLSFFDRFATAPLLVLAVRDLNVPLSAAVQLVTVYALLYAVGQPFWGAISDRLGRRAVLLLALSGTVLGSAASVFVPGLTGLLFVRAATGLFVGALFPTVLTLVGDRYAGTERSRQISTLQSFTAIGTTAATLLAGLIGVALGWRAVFALSGLAAACLLVLVWQVTEPERVPAPHAIWQSFGRWPLALYAVGIVEGGLLLGIFTYIVPALERDGVSVALAGILGSAYGLGIIAGAMTSRRISDRISRTTSIGVGGGMLVLAYAVAAIGHTPASLTIAAALLGLCNSLLHASLQGLATELTPAARATTVSLFVCSVFIGSSIAVALTAAQTASGYREVFAETAAGGLIMTAAAVAVSRAWSRSRRADS